MVSSNSYIWCLTLNSSKWLVNHYFGIGLAKSSAFSTRTSSQESRHRSCHAFNNSRYFTSGCVKCVVNSHTCWNWTSGAVQNKRQRFFRIPAEITNFWANIRCRVIVNFADDMNRSVLCDFRGKKVHHHFLTVKCCDQVWYNHNCFVSFLYFLTNLSSVFILASIITVLTFLVNLRIFGTH